MSRNPIPASVMLTHDNADRIAAVANKRGFTINHWHDNIDYHLEEDEAETILFTSVYPWIPAISNFGDVPFDPSCHPAPGVPLMETDEFIALLETTPEIG